MLNAFYKLPMFYIACPYSHKSYAVRAARAEAQQAVMWFIIHNGGLVFAPLEHSWRIAEENDVDDGEYWLKVDMKILPVCDYMIVLQVWGWDESVGVQKEINAAEALGIPIIYLKSDDVRRIMSVKLNYDRKLDADKRRLHGTNRLRSGWVQC